MKVEKFWMVHRMDALESPSRRHANEPSAFNEAERLACQHPDAVFVLLKATRACRVHAPPKWVDCE